MKARLAEKHSAANQALENMELSPKYDCIVIPVSNLNVQGDLSTRFRYQIYNVNKSVEDTWEKSHSRIGNNRLENKMAD